MTLNIVVCFMCGICYDSGFGGFRTDLPNGERVSHPCKPNTFWQGVGHRNAAGGGSRNPFGIDFDNHGKQWTRELCMKDSDGDGKTNGYELGDPDCEWVKGEIPKRTEDIAHPVKNKGLDNGVCTPFYDFRCQAENDWVDCKKEEFVCPALSRPDTENITLRFTRTQVPPQETTYKCMIFDVPSDQDYHIVALRPETTTSCITFFCTAVTTTKDKFLTDPMTVVLVQATTVVLYWVVGHWVMLENV